MDIAHSPAVSSRDDLDANEGRILSNILRSLRKTWRIPVLFGLLIFAICLGLIFFLRSALVQTSTYIARINFTFPGADQGQYPNGLPVSLNEVIEPANLDTVYTRLKLSELGIKREDFLAGFSIRPYAPIENEVAERYRAQLADRRLSFAERARIETDFKLELERISRTGAEISFTVRGRFGIPDETGRSIVNAIPPTWSQAMIEQKGVLNFPGFNATQTAIEPSVPKGVSLPVAIVLVYQANQRLMQRVEDIRSRLFRAIDRAEIEQLHRGILTTTDRTTGKSFRDLEQEAMDISMVNIGRLKSTLMRYDWQQGVAEGRNLIERRLRNLESLEAEYANRVEMINQVLARYVNAVAGLKGRVSEGRAGSDENRMSSDFVTIPQLSENFIDKIVELSGARNAEDRRFIVTTTAQQARYNGQLINIRTELNEWRDLYKFMDNSEREKLTPAASSEIANAIEEGIAAINKVWAALTRMEAEFATSRLGQTMQLYAPYSAAGGVRHWDPVWNQRSFLFALSAAFLCAIGLWIVRVLLYLSRGASNEGMDSTFDPPQR